MVFGWNEETVEMRLSRLEQGASDRRELEERVRRLEACWRAELKRKQQVAQLEGENAELRRQVTELSLQLAGRVAGAGRLSPSLS